MRRSAPLALLLIGFAACSATNAAPQGQRAAGPPGRAAALQCDPDDGGLALPEGFCAVVVARDIGAARHLAVAGNGDVFVAVGGRSGGGVVALRDTTGDGRADLVRRFGEGVGNGIALHGGYLWYAPHDRVVRWPWQPGQLEPAGEPEVMIRDLPVGGHRSKSLAFGADGALYVSIGSPSNSCQVDDRADRSPGKDPCEELATRAGIWRFDPARPGQVQADGRRWATGMRNAVAVAVQPGTGMLWAAIHGRDQLGENWGFSDRDNAEKPAEEFGPVPEGADYGWPYCYHDPDLRRKVDAPEYGGDGSRAGRCGGKTDPAIAFPAHWAPNGAAFYTGAMFGAEYEGGAFVAFHGSWNRAPLPQAGYRVVFAPFRDGRPTGTWRDFATGRGGPTSIRPTGLAVGPDGSLYLAADREQAVWRIVRR